MRIRQRRPALVQAHRPSPCEGPRQRQQQPSRPATPRSILRYSSSSRRPSFLIAFLVCGFACLLSFGVVDGRVAANRRQKQKNSPLQRSVLVKNDSGSRIDVFWIHPETRERAPSNFQETDGIVYGSEGGLVSYVGHSFEVVEMPLNAKKNPKKCRRGMCRRAYFTVNSNEDQLFTVQKDFMVVVEDSKTRAKDKAKKALLSCKALARAAFDEDDPLTPLERIDKLTACLVGQIDATLNEQKDEIDFQVDVRKTMGKELVRYACGDLAMNTSAPIRNETWDDSQGDSHDVRVLFETEISSLWVVEKFLTDSQCGALVDGASVKFGDVGDGDGVDRKILPAAEARTSSNVLDSAVEKIEELIGAFLGVAVNYRSGQTMEVRTQTSTVETAEGGNSGEDQQECNMDAKDGSCKSSKAAVDVAASDKEEALKEVLASSSPVTPAVHGGVNLRLMPQALVRANPGDVATLRILCDVPDNGSGGLYFPKTGDHVNPKEHKGSAILLVYRDPGQSRKELDPFIEEYYECPVVASTKQSAKGGGEKLVSIIDHYGDPAAGAAAATEE